MNLNDYSKLPIILGYEITRAIDMIELSNDNVALISNNEPYPIVIIDSSSYQIITNIQLEKNISYCSSLFPIKQE